MNAFPKFKQGAKNKNSLPVFFHPAIRIRNVSVPTDSNPGIRNTIYITMTKISPLSNLKSGDILSLEEGGMNVG
jgi:hypothetical protein